MDSHKIIVIVVAIIAIVGLSFLFGVSKTDTYEDGDLAGEAFRFRSNDNSEGKTLGQNLVQAKTELGEVPKFPVEAEFYVERKSDAFIEFGSDVIYYPYYEVNWKLSSGLPLEATVAAVKIKNFLGEDLDAHGVSKTCSTDNKVCEGKFIIQMGSNYAPHTSANIEPFPKGEDKPSYLSYAEAFDKCYYDTEFVSGLEPDDLFEACA